MLCACVAFILYIVLLMWWSSCVPFLVYHQTSRASLLHPLPFSFKLPLSTQQLPQQRHAAVWVGSVAESTWAFQVSEHRLRSNLVSSCIMFICIHPTPTEDRRADIWNKLSHCTSRPLPSDAYLCVQTQRPVVVEGGPRCRIQISSAQWVGRRNLQSFHMCSGWPSFSRSAFWIALLRWVECNLELALNTFEEIRASDLLLVDARDGAVKDKGSGRGLEPSATAFFLHRWGTFSFIVAPYMLIIAECTWGWNTVVFSYTVTCRTQLLWCVSRFNSHNSLILSSSLDDGGRRKVCSLCLMYTPYKPSSD